jgi:hypothetical protein
LHNKARKLTTLTILILLGVLLSPLAIEGTWASPNQDPSRQTVPPTLEPQAYMPSVTSNYPAPDQLQDNWQWDRPTWPLNGPFPSTFGTGSELEPSEVDSGAVPDPSPYPSEATQPQSPSALCRLGVDKVSRPLGVYHPQDLENLRAGWYFNWGTSMDPDEPNGIQFAQSVYVKQWKWNDGLALCDVDAPYAEPYTYTVKPAISTIRNIAAANPGSLWLLGNEIERRDWGTSNGGCSGQNEILPEVYAWAYHDIYTAIKASDPTARVANGSIIVPTPLRLEYMDRIWNEYLRRYRTHMPVDVWHIHSYLGPEKRDSWGIEIPVGIDADVGMFYFGGDWEKRILVNKDFSYIPDLVRDFRSWMKDKGQQNKPLIISEFGVSMPDWIMEGEFTPEKVRDEYMNPGLTFMLNTKDPNLGYPADEYRLVQSVWWWSLDGDGGSYEGGEFYQYFNGNLFWSGLGPPTHSPNGMGLSTLGNYWANYTSGLAENVNLRPLAVDGTAFSDTGEPVTATIRIQLSNSGNIAITQPFSVTVYADGDQPIGSVAVDHLEGCGQIAEAIVTWPSVDPGAYAIRVHVDSTGQIAEVLESDNELSGLILVGTYRVNLPLVLRAWPPG